MVIYTKYIILLYPKATSKTIIIVNPISTKSVTKFLRLFIKHSGINSLTTTYTMAPAAKQRKKGNISLILITRSAPITPLIGSTKPDNCP